jgi:transglutaminase-like putative cysteine protease
MTTDAPLLDVETMRGIAARCACKIVRVQRWRSLVPGRPGLAYELSCRTHLDKLKLLDLLSWNEAKRDAQLQEFALSLAQEAGPRKEQQARNLHEFVRDSIRFVREPRERFADAWWTLELGQGDCDDKARLLVSLARAIRLPARFVPLMLRADLFGPNVPGHVCAQFGFPTSAPKRWVWAETTLPGARWGEHPRAAKQRLGARAKHRGDIGGAG